MSGLLSNVTRRGLWLAVFGAIILFLVLAGQGGASPSAREASSSGKPAAGPPARLSEVDLKALPPAPPRSNKSSVLPFRSPHGRAQSPGEARNSDPPAIASFARALDIPAVAPQIITGFNGINSEVSGGSGGPCGCVPPDGDMAAGPNNVVVDVNQAFQVFDKQGNALTQPVGFDTFFNGCGPAGLVSSDAIAAYDPEANRFTLGILRYDSTTDNSYVSLAVSQSGDPTSSYNRYCFEQLYQNLPALYDFPHISVGQTALFTTGNVYPSGSEQSVSARVNAFDKAAMYSGAITATQIYTDVTLNSDSTTADTIRPALFNVGLPTSINYFVNVSSTSPSSRVTVWRWTDPFGTNNFVQAGGVDVATFLPAVPMLQPPPGQPMPPSVYIDTRTLAGVWANGTLWSAHTIGCNPGTGVTDCIQWYQVGNLDSTPTILQQGVISGTAESRAYPNLAVDIAGNVELAYAYSSLTDFIGLRHVGRLAGDPPGAMGGEATIKAGEMAEIGYNALRYGDFSGSVTDPDGLGLWHFEEYTQNINDPTGSWGTWASESRFPPQGTTTPIPSRTPASTSTHPPTETPGGPTDTATPTHLPTAFPSATATQPGTGTVIPLTATNTVPAQGTATITPTACVINFEDVPTSNPFYAYIECLACKGIIAGYDCGGPGMPCNPNHDPYFRPFNNVTRGQAAKFISNSAGYTDPIPATQQSFSDVPPTQTFWLWVERVYAHGAISGYPCGGPGEPCDPQQRPYFRPGNNMTRGQLAKIDANAAGYHEQIPPDQVTFHDVPYGSAFWIYVERVHLHGVISGYPCGGRGEPCDPQQRPYFRPNNQVTRGQTSKIVSNTFFQNCTAGPQLK